MSYRERIITAIDGLDDRRGSSHAAIKKHMNANSPESEEWQNSVYLRTVKDMVKGGDLVKNGMLFTLSEKLREKRKKHVAFSAEICSPHQPDPRMADLWRAGQLCDSEIVSADGCSFNVHRFVLAMKSDYMKALLAEDRFKDSSDCPINLPDVSSREVQHLLEWMYAGKCTVTSLSEWVDLLEAASRLQCQDLVAQLEAVMIDNVDEDSCLCIWDLAERLHLGSLTANAKKVALENFLGLATSEEFKELSLEKLFELIKDDRLGVAKEEEVFTSVISWVKAQKESPPTSEEIEKLLSCVRFPLMEENFVTEQVLEESVLINNSICFRAVARYLARYRTASARKGIGTPLRWEDVVKGVKVRIIDDIEELKKLCKQPAPGARSGAGWDSNMRRIAGKRFLVNRIYETMRSVKAEPSEFVVPFTALRFA